MNDTMPADRVDRRVRRAVATLNESLREAVDVDAGLRAVYESATDAPLSLPDDVAHGTLPSANRGGVSRWPAWPGRVLRSIAGANERVLDEVPMERPRFTALGAILVLSSSFNVLSAYLALRFALPDQGIVLIAPAALWGLIVLSLDRFLVAAELSPRRARRLIEALPRVMLGGIVGVLMAEPLIMRLFQPAIEGDLLARGVVPSLLGRIEALENLSRAHPPMGRALWALRIFFVVFAAMPVATRLLAPRLTYDRIVDARRAMAEAEILAGALAAQLDAEVAQDHVLAEAAIRRAEIAVNKSQRLAMLLDCLDDPGGIRSSARQSAVVTVD